ncbi:lysosomal-associated transmembrane protein 4B-like [Talpa occidentalis]|uniref:lysosomal-associated transmembrane protein 4B-like n=1 Tax=Talpa occidentalis TaxID=50954 RepID=UPI00188FEFF1|nr:lysosomal-associated transmembrane protein 4B-like [Talpa occidentalis]
MDMVAPFYSTRCCGCRSAHWRTVLFAAWYLITNAVVLLILLSALAKDYFSDSELGGDFEFINYAKMWIIIAVSLLIFLIGAMAIYGAYKQHAVWIIPFHCYQIFDFALNASVILTTESCSDDMLEFIRQMPPNFPYRDDLMSLEPTGWCVAIFLFVIVTLTIKCYLIASVWNCYLYIKGRNSSDVPVYAINNDTTESWASAGGAGG